MRDMILRKIEKLEHEKQIRILYAVESGSRAWGFASQDSDWDVRFIYIHHPDWYLQIEKVKDNMGEITPDNIDITGWELRKAFQLLVKSNTPFLEWLRSPIVYRQHSSVVDRIRELIPFYFDRRTCMNHYYNIAANSFAQYLSNGNMKL
ncbi:MAG: nucleotidyltransferase domain-containing protein [Candidatus Cloacimonetes bacterium]|nr:nucleotidyltransferase domain-containing protein [Candidatus Cloacimonadota bacterium]